MSSMLKIKVHSIKESEVVECSFTQMMLTLLQFCTHNKPQVNPIENNVQGHVWVQMPKNKSKFRRHTAKATGHNRTPTSGTWDK